MKNLFIFKSDFRLKDNPALYRASHSGDSLDAIFIFNQQKWRDHNESDLKIAFQIEHLKILSKELDDLNIPLKIIFADGIKEEAPKIIEYVTSNNLQNVFVNKEYGLNEIQRDSDLERDLKKVGVKHHIFNSSIFNPDSIKTQSETFFKVYTPFSKAFRSKLSTKQIEVLGIPKKQSSKQQNSDEIPAVDLQPNKKET